MFEGSGMMMLVSLSIIYFIYLFYAYFLIPFSYISFLHNIIVLSALKFHGVWYLSALGVWKLCTGSLILISRKQKKVVKFPTIAPTLYSVLTFSSISVFSACYVQFWMCHVKPQFDLTLWYTTQLGLIVYIQNFRLRIECCNISHNTEATQCEVENQVSIQWTWLCLEVIAWSWGKYWTDDACVPLICWSYSLYHFEGPCWIFN